MTDTSVTVHAICGGVGAGKTTLARKLAEQTGAMLFSGDDWMRILYWPDMTDPPDPDWVLARLERMEEVVWSQVGQAARLGLSSVLDLGLSDPDHRGKFAGLCEQAGFEYHLHWLDLPTDVRWGRTRERNRNRGSTYAMEVTRELFDFVEDRWIEPTAAEQQAFRVTRYTR